MAMGNQSVLQIPDVESAKEQCDWRSEVVDEGCLGFELGFGQGFSNRPHFGWYQNEDPSRHTPN
jgi:hypothetical protein